MNVVGLVEAFMVLTLSVAVPVPLTSTTVPLSLRSRKKILSELVTVWERITAGLLGLSSITNA